MIFSDIYKGPRSPLAKLRHHSLPATASETTPISADAALTNRPDWVNDEHADLLSKDKVKQKEAVKRYLSAKVKNDWIFTWPPESLETIAPVAKPAVNAETTTGDSHAGAGTGGDSVQEGETHEIESMPVISALPVNDKPATVQDEVKDDDGYQVETDDDETPSVRDSGDGADDVSVYSIVSEDPLHYRPRMDWTSDASDSEPIPFNPSSRLNSPEDLDADVLTTIEARKAKQRREAREEAKWNEGLACFEARRNAWTGARTVRIKSKPALHSVSPRSGRRFFFRRSISSSPPAVSMHPPIGSTASPPNSGADTSVIASDASSSANNDGDKLHPLHTKDSIASVSQPETSYPVETLLPLAPPILPPENCLRASINPSVYINLYEKVILSSLQPSCPINLSDMIRSCVVGWQRDGEWPPRPVLPSNASAAAAAAAAQKKKQQKAKRLSNAGVSDGGGGSNIARRMSFGLLGSGGSGGAGKERDDEGAHKGGKGFRRSLQKALGIGSLSIEGTAVS